MVRAGGATPEPMATSESGLPTGGPHDFSEPHSDSRDEIATRLELRDVAALGDDLVRKLGEYDGRRQL